MNRLFNFTLVMSVCCQALIAQEIEYVRAENTPESCTSIMVGKKASTDGSVMTSHTCDGNYRTWMTIVPAVRYERDTMLAVYSGKLHTESVDDRTGMEQKGVIPEVRSTYQYLNTGYPCLNEKQLAIGESTIGGRKELENKKGLFMIEELEKIVLQRCTTAREAIRMKTVQTVCLIFENLYYIIGKCRVERTIFKIMNNGITVIGRFPEIPNFHIIIA